MTDANIVTTQLMFYDTYECEFGDGFYPMIQQDDLAYKQIAIKFAYDKLQQSWIQISEMNISGLDGDTGINLLDAMNKKHNVNGISIYNILLRKV